VTVPGPDPAAHQAHAGATIAGAMVASGLALPAGYTLVTLAERRDLEDALGDHNTAAWPRFMLEDPVAERYWHHLDDELAGYQLLLLDGSGAIAAAGNCAPLAWDGTDAGLPLGWDDQFMRTVGSLNAGRAVDTTGALQIVVAPGRLGSGLSALLVGAFRALARLQGHRALIACVRPTLKDRYPLTPIERYAVWTRPDGQPFDPWIRVHARLGARIVRGVPDSMRIEGSVADWEAWTEMAFPESGAYVVPRAADVVRIDREADRGVYLDPNVWMVHDLAR
jgi:GNAT superfamily N-acetyltransferase